MFDEKKEFIEEAISIFSLTLQFPSLSPTQRLFVAKSWAYAAEQHHHPSALAAYDTLLQATRELASLSLDIESRQQALSSGGDGLTRKAALCAIQLHDYGKAIEYLETGRAVVWSQVLHLRTPLDRLLEVALELGERLHNIATQLEVASHRNTFAEPTDNKRNILLKQEEHNLESLSAEWLGLINQVRGVEGFEEFLKPPRLSGLQAAAFKGPIVFLIPAYDESHCLIMTSTDIHHLSLPALSALELLKMNQLLQAAASQDTLSRSSIDHLQGNLVSFEEENMAPDVGVSEERAIRPVGALRSDDVFKRILKILWDELVKPVIEVLGIKVKFHLSLKA